MTLLLDLTAGEATVHVNSGIKKRAAHSSDLALGVAALPRLTTIGKLDVTGLIPVAMKVREVENFIVVMVLF